MGNSYCWFLWRKSIATHSETGGGGTGFWHHLRKLCRSKITPSDGPWGWLPFPSRAPCKEPRFDEIQCPDITVTALAPWGSTQTEVLESGSDQVFSLVGFLFLGDCWIGSQVIYLASCPGWFVCVHVNVTRQKISLHCYMGEKQRNPSLQERYEAGHSILLALYKPLPG